TRTIAEIIAVRRSSLVLNTGRTAAGGMDALRSFATEATDEPERMVPPSDLGFARAASGTVLAQLRDDAPIAVRPRPLLRLPDGRIALDAHLAATHATDEHWVTPAIVPLG
ncbi:MAG: hypothetical protein WA971_02465, partial [Microbacterium sp.]